MRWAERPPAWWIAIAFVAPIAAAIALIPVRGDTLGVYGGVAATSGPPWVFKLQASSEFDLSPGGPPRCSALSFAPLGAVTYETLGNLEPVVDARVGLWTFAGGATFGAVMVIDTVPDTLPD